MFTPTLRCECAQPASDRLMRKWCIVQVSSGVKIMSICLETPYDHQLKSGEPLTKSVQPRWGQTSKVKQGSSRVN